MYDYRYGVKNQIYTRLFDDNILKNVPSLSRKGVKHESLFEGCEVVDAFNCNWFIADFSRLFEE